MGTVLTLGEASWRRRSVAVVAGWLLLAACSGSPAVRRSGPMRVVASFYPLQFVVGFVGGSHVAVTNLTPVGAEPHDLELSARDDVGLARAALVVYLHGFAPAVDDAVNTAARSHALDVAGAARLVGTGTGADPHFWLDPMRLADVGDAVAARLATVDPVDAAQYRSDAAVLRQRLVALDGTLRAGLAHCAQTTIVTSHTAFGYLAARYGLTQIGVTGLNPDQEPTPTQLATVVRFIVAHHVRTVWTETLVSPAVAHTIAVTTGASTAVLDPLEGLARGAQDYFGVMRADLALLEHGLGCA